MAVDAGKIPAEAQNTTVTGTVTEHQDLSKQNAQNVNSRKPRPRRPNYNEIHSKPVPVNVFPLPAFIPHNPISFVRIALSLLSHFIVQPKSHSVIHEAYYSSQTQSIHVTDAASIRALWEQGFWGKGSLSRSEPQWLAGEKKKRGIEESKTSAEVTQSRREERKQFKLERARAQREAIEQQLRQEGKLDADGSVEELVDEGQVSESPLGTIYDPENGNIVTVSGDSITSEISKTLTQESLKWSQDGELAQVKDQEHLQLTPEEGFYLAYALGALSILSDGDGSVEEPPLCPYPAWYLLRLYAVHSSTPVNESKVLHLQNAYQARERAMKSYEEMSSIPSIEPDNPFILRYIVFHHFRSLGWVVRPGIKFAVDYLLYLRGPAFHHAEFAVMIVPSYSHSYWTDAPESETHISQRKEELGKKDWWWLHRVNRVQTAVFKTLVLVYVEVPPHWDNTYQTDGWRVDIGSVLKQYNVREVVVKRWSPNRNRD